MHPSVEESWALIAAWLREHIPAAFDHLQPPASAEAISAVRAAMNRGLPADLVAWLSIADGFTHHGSFGNLLPFFFNPLPCAEMLREREVWQSVFGTRERRGDAEPAGTYSMSWLNSFLPIAESGTDVSLYVDLRAGDLFGSVGKFDSESGTDLPQWTSTTEMLADVAAALTLDQPALVDLANRRRTTDPYSTPAAWKPSLDEGQLTWTSIPLDPPNAD
ncbi:SMI1/KNR4 family protein [Kribbella sp. NPDC055071]